MPKAMIAKFLITKPYMIKIQEMKKYIKRKPGKK